MCMYVCVDVCVCGCVYVCMYVGVWVCVCGCGFYYSFVLRTVLCNHPRSAREYVCVRIQAGNISAIGPIPCAPLSALFCTICSLSAECKGRVHVYNAGGVNGVSGQDSR